MCESSSDLKTTWAHAALFRPATRHRLVPQLVDHLREQITIGVLHEYQRLPPMHKLAELCGVSVPTLREALQTLAYLGFVRIVHGAGTFVAHGPHSHTGTVAAIRHARKSDMVTLRGIIEVEAARRAAQRHVDRELFPPNDRLLEAAWELRRGPGTWADEYVERDLAFHRAIVVRSGAAFAAVLHREACQQLEVDLVTDAPRLIDVDDLEELHQALYQAIEEHRPGEAARLARRIAAIERPRSAEVPATGRSPTLR